MGKSNRLSWLKKPRVTIPLVIIILIIAAVALAIRNMNTPAQGSINEAPAAQAQKSDPYAQPGTYKGKYITFSYPAHFKRVPTKLSGSYQEVIEYHATDDSVRLINIGVSPGEITSDSGYTYRAQHNDLYRQNSSRIGVEFIKLDGTEDTFFIQHGGQMATVSATSPYGGLNGEALFVASSLKWLK